MPKGTRAPSFRQARQQEPLLWWWGIAQLALVPIALVAMALDPRTVDGVDNWLKPTKFLIGGGIYCLTVALLLLPLTPGRPRTYIRRATAIALAIEHLIISTQAARGVPSHFARSLDLNGLAYAIMGWAIAALTIAAVVLFVRYLRDPAVRTLPAPLLLSIRIALAISLLGSIAGGAMSGINSHSVGADNLEAATEPEGLPLVGWSTQHGDLRPAHFAGLHAIQVVPAMGWWMSRPSPSHRAHRISAIAGVGAGMPNASRAPLVAVWLAGLAYGTLVLALFATALLGIPALPS